MTYILGCKVNHLDRDCKIYIFIYMYISWSFNLLQVRNRGSLLQIQVAPKRNSSGINASSVLRSASWNFTTKQQPPQNWSWIYLPCAGKNQDCREDSHLQRYLPEFTEKNRASKRDMRHPLKVISSKYIPARQYIYIRVLGKIRAPWDCIY